MSKYSILCYALATSLGVSGCATESSTPIDHMSSLEKVVLERQHGLQDEQKSLDIRHAEAEAQLLAIRYVESMLKGNYHAMYKESKLDQVANESGYTQSEVSKLLAALTTRSAIESLSADSLNSSAKRYLIVMNVCNVSIDGGIRAINRVLGRNSIEEVTDRGMALLPQEKNTRNRSTPSPTPPTPPSILTYGPGARF